MREQLFNKDVSGGYEEGRPADGIIAIKTDYTTDEKVKNAMVLYGLQNKDYNGVINNCTDYAIVGLKVATGNNRWQKEIIPTLNPITPFIAAHTPNMLFQQTRSFKNATILKNSGDLVNKSFLIGKLGL